MLKNESQAGTEVPLSTNADVSTPSQTIAKPNVSDSFSAEDMGKASSEGYHRKVDEIKGIKPVKFSEWLKNYR